MIRLQCIGWGDLLTSYNGTTITYDASLSNARLDTYVDAAIKYLGNLVSDEFLNWAGK